MTIRNCVSCLDCIVNNETDELLNNKMERKSIFTWQDAIKLAIGIMLGLTPTVYIMKSSVKVEEEPKNESYIEYVYTPTVYDILEEREDMIHALWVDSVYYTMPESILTQILVNKGTKLSRMAIVEEYLMFLKNP